MTPKLKRFCPGCAQRTLQMNAAPCEICGRVNEITPPQPREKMHFAARILRALLAPLGRFSHGLTLIFCAFAFWSMALHGIVPFLGFLSLGLVFSGLIVVGIWLLRLATRGAVWLFAPATRQNKRPGARTFGVLPVCLALLWVLNRFEVPLRVAFWLSRPGLERRAGFVPPLKGTATSRVPWRAGLYRNRQTDIDSKGNVRIEVTNSHFLWSGTKAGFAKCSQGCAAAKFPPVYWQSSGPRYLQLSRDWFWWEESGSDD